MNPSLEAESSVSTSAEIEDASIPFAVTLELVLEDAETIRELIAYPEGASRDRFATEALRIGLLALKQARGQLDADLVRKEGDRLILQLENQLSEHATLLNDRFTHVLKDYFDPEDGRFHERVERLVKQDGELEQLLHRQIGDEDSELCKTLAAHFGKESQLMKILGLESSDGLLATFRDSLEEQLKTQRDHLLKQFSLDYKEGALARFLGELEERQGEFSDDLHKKVDIIVKEFSLDQEDSALNRLVKNVERAQRTITKEFSLDEETSALTRLKKELLELHESQRKTNQEFQEEVKGTLNAMVARKQESQRSTRHGLEFEDAVCEFLEFELRKTGDVVHRTGNETGCIKKCKVGDAVVVLSSESIAPEAKIVVEAKENAQYTLAKARSEIETARENRESEIGIFVFSQKTVSENIDQFARFGNDIFLVWDPENTQNDVVFQSGISLAKALCVRKRAERQSVSIDLSEFDRVCLAIEKQVGALDDIETWSTTIQNNSDKILKKLRKIRHTLDDELETLSEQIEDLKMHLSQSMD